MGFVTASRTGPPLPHSSTGRRRPWAAPGVKNRLASSSARLSAIHTSSPTTLKTPPQKRVPRHGTGVRNRSGDTLLGPGLTNTARPRSRPKPSRSTSCRELATAPWIPALCTARLVGVLPGPIIWTDLLQCGADAQRRTPFQKTTPRSQAYVPEREFARAPRGPALEGPQPPQEVSGRPILLSRHRTLGAAGPYSPNCSAPCSCL